MATQVPGFVWPIVFGVDFTLIAFVVLALRRRDDPRAGRAAMGAGFLLAAWFVLVTLLSAAGAFVTGPGDPPTIGLGVLPPIVAGGLALAFSRTVRARVLAIPQPWLVGIQWLRLIGVVFLVLRARGLLPDRFALPAGWGDFTVGAAAPAVAYALSRGKRWAAPLAVAWNAFGVLDLIVAVGMGALSGASAMAQLPLSLVPTFGVPLFVLLHVASLLGLRARAPARPPRVGAAGYATGDAA